MSRSSEKRSPLVKSKGSEKRSPLVKSKGSEKRSPLVKSKGSVFKYLDGTLSVTDSSIVFETDRQGVSKFLAHKNLSACAESIDKSAFYGEDGIDFKKYLGLKGPSTEDIKRHKDFAGGSMLQLERELRLPCADTSHVDDMLLKIGALNNAVTSTYSKPKRKRVLSEHDGEIDLDRLWDVKYFHCAKKQPVPQRCVKLDVELSASVSTSSESINKYCAVVIAVIERLESMGRTVDLGLTSHSIHHEVSTRARIQIKRAGEYITRPYLAAYFSSNFFRRVIFGIYIGMSHSMHKRTPFGLGTPLPPTERVSVKPCGTIQLSQGKGSFNDRAASEVYSDVLKRLT